MPENLAPAPDNIGDGHNPIALLRSIDFRPVLQKTSVLDRPLFRSGRCGTYYCHLARNTPSLLDTERHGGHLFLLGGYFTAF